MPAANYDFIIEQGARFLRSIYWRDSSDNPVDLTNYTASLKVRKRYDSAVLLSLSTGGGGITITGASGLITIDISEGTTSGLSFYTALYDLELYPPAPNAGNVIRLMQGKVTLEREVTKA